MGWGLGGGNGVFCIGCGVLLAFMVIVRGGEHNRHSFCIYAFM